MALHSVFHPEALQDYADATEYYLRNASKIVAISFAFAIESAITSLLARPQTWRVAEEPDVRRYVIHRFPFVIYCRWEPERDCVFIYAIMHCSRKPGYWSSRLRTDI